MALVITAYYHTGRFNSAPLLTRPFPTDPDGSVRTRLLREWLSLVLGSPGLYRSIPFSSFSSSIRNNCMYVISALLGNIGSLLPFSMGV